MVFLRPTTTLYTLTRNAKHTDMLNTKHTCIKFRICHLAVSCMSNLRTYKPHPSFSHHLFELQIRLICDKIRYDWKYNNSLTKYYIYAYLIKIYYPYIVRNLLQINIEPTITFFITLALPTHYHDSY